MAPAVSPAGSPDAVKPAAPLSKGSVLCFMLSNIKLCSGDTEIQRTINYLPSDESDSYSEK